jgi:PAS domain S-box-containing protein
MRNVNTILNVDDHLPSRYARTRLLKQAGFRVVEAGTGEEALRMAAEGHPALVLLDVNLPDISGFEVCRRIKAEPSIASTTVMYLTASARSADDQVRGYEDGGSVFLVEPVEPEVLLATVRALIREREADAAIERLAAIVESSDDAIVSHSLQGTITSWNSGAARMYGYAAGEVLFGPLALLFAANHAGECPAMLERLRRGERVRNFETVHARKDGSLFDVALSLSPLRDATGALAGAATIARDIRDRKLLEHRLLSLQKIESLGALAGGIAHDFNNLLTGVLGNASLALDELEPDHGARPMVSEVIRAADRAAHLTSQLLAYAGLGRFVLASFDLSEFVRDNRELLEATVSKNVELRFELADGLPRIEADPSQIQQLLVNLVVNGAEAIGIGRTGEVRIVTRQEETDSEHRHVCLEIGDDGCGMDQRTLARIYDPFFSTKFTGRGLGLAAVSGIVRSHNGRMEVTSEPGRGTTFRVFLPSAGRQREQSPRTVLVVDDEEIVRTTARLALEKHGFKVLQAEDGIAAVQVFESNLYEISAVLLDLAMPGMNGEHVIPRLRALRPDIPILVMSGHDENKAAERLGGRAVAGFIPKPYTAGVLAERVKALFAEV